MIAEIELRMQAIGMARIARQLVEVDNRIEVSGGSNPLIHGLPIGLNLRPGMVVLGSHERHDGGANYLDSMRMSTGDNLLIGITQAADFFGVFSSGDAVVSGQHSEIIHPFQHNYPLHSWLCEDIVVEACQRVRPQSIQQKPIAAYAVIQYRDILRVRLSLQSPRKNIRPSVVTIRGRAVPVGD